MNIRLRLALASALVVAFGACASGSSSGGGAEAPAATPTPGAERLDPGEPPRENEQTDLAADHLDDAASAEEDGDAALAQDHYQQALTAAGQAIEMDQRNPLPWYQGGLAHMGLENYQAADSMLTRAEELRPIYTLETARLREEQWVELYNQGISTVNEGSLEQALPYFEGAAAIYHERPEALSVLGQIYHNVGRYDDAAESFRAALEIINSDRIEERDSATAATWREQGEQLPLQLAQTLTNAQRYNEAAQVLEDLVAEDPENVLLRKNLANLYIQMEMPDSAQSLYEELLARPDLTPVDQYQVGVGFYQLSEYDLAADAFQDAVRSVPQNRDAAEMWARSLQLMYPPGERQDSVQVPPEVIEELSEAADTWLELDPHSRNARLIAAQTATRLDNQERARDLVTAIEEMPFAVENLQLLRGGSGGGQVTGTVTNMTEEPGTSLTVEVTFFDNDGNQVGTGSTTVELPAQEASQSFQVPIETDVTLGGYTYEVRMM